MKRSYLFLIIILITGCQSRPVRPTISAGETESLRGVVDLESAELIGVDTLLDGGSTAFFLKDKNGNVSILKYNKNDLGDPVFALVVAPGDTKQISPRELENLSISLMSSLKKDGHSTHGDTACRELIRLMRSNVWVYHPIHYWRKSWIK